MKQIHIVHFSFKCSLGLVDVERGRSLLPETYKFYKGGPKPSPRQEQPNEETPPITTSSVTLPLTLKNTFWNGERWCSAEFSARTAKVLNGFELLQVELKQSEEHLHNVRYFVKHDYASCSLDNLYLCCRSIWINQYDYNRLTLDVKFNRSQRQKVGSINFNFKLYCTK